jgi:hypothetical protein
MRVLFWILEEFGMRKQGLLWVIGLALLVACGANSGSHPNSDTGYRTNSGRHGSCGCHYGT